MSSNDSVTDTSNLLAFVNVPSLRCVAGYTGAACRDCVRPGFYRLGSSCKPCPAAASGLVVLLALAFGA